MDVWGEDTTALSEWAQTSVLVDSDRRERLIFQWKEQLMTEGRKEAVINAL